MERNIHIFGNGVQVYADHLMQIQLERYMKRNVHEAEEEDVFVAIIKAISPDGCFVNIGSAIGYYLLLAKLLSPRLTVHGVEPLERHRTFCMENITLNGQKASNFNIHAVGISASDGRAEFLENGYGSCIQNKTESELALLKKSNSIKTIETQTLDTLCDAVGMIIDLCQMDVQGLELDVLAGAECAMEEGRIKTFLIGTHSQKIHDDCRELLIGNGYVIEYDNYETKDQPDGILAASKGCLRLNSLNN